MPETLGQKLQLARTARSLSVEDAAHATKIRAGRILDIERDEYQNFPHMTYAKHFVVLYSRYLAVDPAPYLGDFDSSNRFDLEDYQYLKETAPVAQVRLPEQRRRPKRIVAFAGASFVAFAGFFCWLTYLSVQRLGDIDSLADRSKKLEAPAGVDSSPTAETDRSPEELLSSETAAIEQTKPLPLESNANTQIAPAVETEVIAMPVQMPSAAPVAERIEVIAEAVAAEPLATRAASSVGSDEVVVRTTRPTWVTVTLNDHGARPAFDDYLKPGDNALRFKGRKFWVFVDDVSSVEIRKNSEVVQLTANNSLIQ